MPDKAAKAIRRFCMECQGGHVPSVAACADENCLLYPLRRYKPEHPPAAPAVQGDAVAPSRQEKKNAAPKPQTTLPLFAPAEPDTPADTPARATPAQRPPASPAAGNNIPGFVLPTEPPARIIRRFCMACAGSRQEVRACDAKDHCALWSYRFGVSPATFKRVAARVRKLKEEPLLPGIKL